MNEAVLTEINIIVPLLAGTVGLLFVVLIDPYIQKKQRWLMVAVVILVMSLLIHEWVASIVEMDRTKAFESTLCAIFAYSVRPMLIVIFCYIVGGSRKHVIEWGLIVVNALIHMTALFSHICFWMSEDNYFVRGPLGYTSHIVSVILIVQFLRLSFKEYGHTRKVEIFIPIFSAISIVAATIMDSFGGELRFLQVPFLMFSILGSCFFIYIWIHLQYVRNHENDILAQQRIRIMVSQMQPHFMYNSLTVIGSYLGEPEKAEKALDNFTGFLKGSMDMLNSTECIPVTREFETVKHFLYLEKERFGDKLKVVLDITDTDYELPAFTIQTLVENAISHGIRHSKGGRGILIVKSYETDTAHVIEVQDDGAGFSENIDWNEKTEFQFSSNDTADGHSHIGLVNLRERLVYMCHGAFRIHSRPGQGTIVTVLIPKKPERIRM